MASESSTDVGEKMMQVGAEYGLQILASTLAHEIRNPLQAMRLQLDAAKRGRMSGEGLDRIAQGLERIEQVVARVQRLSQTYRLEITRLDLRTLIQDTVGIVKVWAEAGGIEVEQYTRWEGAATIDGDRELLSQVLLNLVTNAIQAMTTGGRLTVGISECENSAEIEVTDTGIGMTSETLKLVGTPFYSTKEKGSGLGLAFCKTVVSLHGGSLEIESVSGKGASFRVRLPKTIRERERHS